MSREVFEAVNTNTVWEPLRGLDSPASIYNLALHLATEPMNSGYSEGYRCVVTH